ncbi:MAG: SUMF1/EgtB/PvdO family nonheme iron enzyme [Acidobacteria bacterium]|nr:SUMF1/EgtB/PvdO family nonheme iron enzyme [Acidobacteriota bacterium]
MSVKPLLKVLVATLALGVPAPAGPSGNRGSVGCDPGAAASVAAVRPGLPGVRPPRLSLAGMAALKSPAEGTLVFNTEKGRLYRYDGAGWTPLGIVPGTVWGVDPIVGALYYVPAGIFTQGSPGDEPCRVSNETPFAHSLTKDIAVMETEVSRQMWAELKAARATLPDDPSNTTVSPGMSNPVNRVTYWEAILFANLLSVNHGLTPCYYADESCTTPIDAANYTAETVYCNWWANGYRLPTEGEWEYACRAGTSTPFWVAEANYTAANCPSETPGLYAALETAAWFLANAPTATRAVGTAGENPWNLRDVHGNVWEWCWDRYTDAYPEGSASDYYGPVEGTFRVLRGGAWDAHAFACRSAFRHSNDPASQAPSHGFRLVRTIDPPQVGPDPVVGQMCFVPAGFVVQGSPPEEVCRGTNETPFTHTLTLAFAAMETEVSRRMWSDLKAVQPTLPADPSSTAVSPGMGHPVNRATFHESLLFANLLSVQNGYRRCYYADAAFTTPLDASNYAAGPCCCDWNANGYRLPSEGEWEHACRAGTTGPFWIDEPAYTADNCPSETPGLYPELETAAWFLANAPTAARAAGTAAPNPWGLKDVHGNLWEWCWDRYAADYPTDFATDYHGPETGSFRVLRGGAWDAHAYACRSAFRHSNDPAVRAPSHGFRLVRTLEAAAVDFNYDGVTDILWRNDASGTLSAWTMSALGLTDMLFLGGISDPDWQVAGVGDINGDRRADLLWKHVPTGTLSVWFVDEFGYVNDMSPGVVDPSWKIVGLADADGDRKADVFWRNDTSGMMSLWFMNESGLRGTGFVGGIGSIDWKVMGVADFDGDAKNDILWRQSSTGTMSIWFVNQYGFAGDMSPGTVDPAWEIVGLGDADGDHRADIFWRNDASGMLSLWFMNASGVKGAAFVGGISDPDWQVAGIGDFDRDGRSDVFWRRLSTGDMSVWFVNERGYAGNMSPGSVDPSWLTLNHVIFAGGM